MAKGAFDLYQAGNAGWLAALDSIAAPVFVLVLLLGSRSPKRVDSGPLAVLGIAMSFLAPWFFELPHAPAPIPIVIFALAASLFYSLLLMAAYATLGRNLGVIPSIKDVVTHGPYSIVRHPIYASFVMISATLLIVHPTLRNFAAFSCLVTGLILRIRAEERLLAEMESYRAYRRSVPHSLVSPLLALPLAPLIALQGFTAVSAGTGPRSVIMQTSFPILSLHPLVYDDWASLFIANHIYPRLLPEEDRELVPSIARSIRFECLKKAAGPLEPCQAERLYLSFREFKSCRGNVLDRRALRTELLSILSAKNWILPGFKTCPPEDSDLCLEYSRVRDVTRRLQNVYFRFGWSAQSSEDKVVGVAPYCFEIEKSSDGVVFSGTLRPRAGLDAPLIHVITSTTASADFNIALFGDPTLLHGSRANIDLITPLAYYVVSNPALRPETLPWNSPEASAIIRAHLARFGLIHRSDGLLSQWMPAGAALRPHPPRPAGTVQELILPDYVPDCEGLSRELRKGVPGLRTRCANTILFIEESIRRRRTDWAGFLTPLSPGAPGRTSVVDQYFSPSSKETWLAGARDPSIHFYRVGIGKSMVTIDHDVICGVRGNPMGHSDLLASDLIYCP